MKRQFLMVALLALTGWAGSSNAALIGTCTYSSGCGPDFNVSTSLVVDYNYTAGTDTGILSITSTVSDVSFLDGQLDPNWIYGNTSLTVIAATGGDENFTLSFDVDGSGNLLGTSSITMNGRVIAYDAALGGLQTAKSYNGTSLDGNLITGGGITQIGWNNNALDFRGYIDGSSLLTTAGYSTGLSGILAMSNTITSSSGNIEWGQDWTAGGTLDVIIPVPAAVWLFVSGLITLISVSRRRI